MKSQLLKTINIGLDARMLGWSGIGRYLENLLKQFSQHSDWFRDKRLLLFVLPDVPPWLSQLVETCEFLRLITVKVPPFSWQEQLILPFLIKKHQIALFHSVQFNVPLFSPATQLTTIHDLAYDRFPEEFSHFFKKVYYKIFFGLALKKSAQIIAVSESTKQDLIKLKGCQQEKIRVIYEGVEPADFRLPPEERLNLDERLLELGVKRPYFLYVGINRPRKNLARLLRAFQVFLAQTRADTQLVLAGSQDPRFLDIDEAVVRLGLKGRVIQTGQVPQRELALLYQGALAFVFPSLYEGFGLPALEAMAAGVPVVVSQTSSLPEIVGKAALLVNPRQVQSIAQGLIKVFQDKNLRQKLIQAGYQQAQYFNWQKTAKQTLQSYDNLLQSRSKG